MKHTKQTREELERERREWKYRFFSILTALVVLFFIFYLYLDKFYDLQQENLALKEQINQSCQAEVINGNLYIGYEDGVRIGYHQDYNGTWYRCARECEVLP